jgi:hypothetical protein
MRPEVPEDRHLHSKTEELITHIKEYIHTNTELIKLKLIDKAASGLSAVVVCVVVSVLFAWVLILASIGTALWINQCMDNRFSGFFIVAGFYLVVALIIYFGRDGIVKKGVANSIINHLSEE